MLLGIYVCCFSHCLTYCSFVFIRSTLRILMKVLCTNINIFIIILKLQK